MPRRPTTLRVVANPFVCLDHEGRPSAAVPFDPSFHSPDRRHVGARHAAEVLEARKPPTILQVRDGMGGTTARIEGDSRETIHDIWFTFESEAQTVPLTPHYREMMRPGGGDGAALIPADEKSARLAGVPFRPPHEVILETAKLKAEQWAKEHDGELPDWANELLKDEDLHASHKGHRALLAAHMAKAAPTQPPAHADPTPLHEHGE